MTERLQKQVKEIQQVLERTGMSVEQLATRVIVKPDTMRKYAKGYQPASDRLMQTIRAVDARAESSDARALLRAAIKRDGRPLPTIAKQMGYDPGIIDLVVNGGGKASEKMIEAFCRELPELSKDELMDGSDNPLVMIDERMSATYGQKLTMQLPPGMKGHAVPLLSMAQAGGWDAGHSDEGWAGECVFALNVDDRRAFAIKVSGNSMDSGDNRNTDLYEGDVIICSPSASPATGRAAVVRTHSGQAFVKFWNRKGDTAVLESANPDYGPIKLPIAEIAGAWPVVQTIRSGMIQKQL